MYYYLGVFSLSFYKLVIKNRKYKVHGLNQIFFWQIQIEAGDDIWTGPPEDPPLGPGWDKIIVPTQK